MKPDSTDTTNADLGSPPPALLGPGQNEFAEGASEFTDEPSRRRFLTIMSASIALAAGTGCNIRPASQRKIYPYTTQPDELTPGVPLFFATSAPLSGYGQGVLARSSEGRPTKIEGNPDAPSSLGGAGLHALASVLDLYDPDRSRGVTHRGSPSSYELAVAAIRAKLYNGAVPKTDVRLRILTETVTSPTLTAQIASLLATFPNARWVQYDAVSRDNARAGIAKAYGKPLNVTYDFLKADVVFAIDADFLTTGPGHVRYARDFADRRKIRADGKDRAEIDAGRQPGRPFKEGVKFDYDLSAELKNALVNRLYAVETMPTNTGAVADHRLALTTTQIVNFTRTLAAALGVAGMAAAGEWGSTQQQWVGELAKDLLAKKGKSIVVAGDHLPAAVHTIVAAINATLGNVGSTVKLSASVEGQVAGKMSDLKTLTAELTAKTVDVLLILGGGTNPAFTAPVDFEFAGVFRKNAEEKTQLSNKGKDSLTAEEKRSLDYLNAFLAVHLGSHQDETGVLCEWHVNEAHYLETWGDIRGHDGTVTIQQPLIAPLHGGRSAIELLGTLLKGADAGLPGASRDPLDVVKATWANTDEVKKTFPNYQKPEVFETFWQGSVRQGVVAGTESVEDKSTFVAGWAADLASGAVVLGKDEYELNFRACPALFDGRFANNAWLQELPKPLTKISWDNAVFVSPATGAKLGLRTKYNFNIGAGEHGRAEVSVLVLEIGGKKLTAPAWMLPGHADDAITVHLGHGRTRAGRVASTPDEPNAAGFPVRGFDVYPYRTSTTLWAAPTRASKVASGKYILACTQGHWSMAEKDPISGKMLDRKPVRRGDIADLKKVPKFAKIPPMATGETELIDANVPHPKKHGGHEGGHDERLVPLNMYQPAEGLVPGLADAQRRRWAMAIDLNACTGCSACVVACQSENNIPTVGKNQVTKGREMYWVSIDRYYEGPDPNNPNELSDPSAVKVYFQPRMCVQCENAPCEIVCPVGATVHSADGLNDMTYNRCVGTRYCSNNCPYKVRRFNFLTFKGNDWETDTLKLGRNPDVSVRSRGVMEKCTFCVQRIRGAEIVAEREFRPIRDGEILTACQAACPSAAIVFGDINDENAVVSKWKNEPTNYGLLAELNTRPRLTHMATIRNPNPAMPK